MSAKILLKCTQCSADVERWPSQQKVNTFCSRGCYESWQSQNLSGSNSHNFKSSPVEKHCEQCDSLFDVSVDRKDKARFCTRSCYSDWMSENQRGENANNWQGGTIDKRLSVEYKMWRLAVLEHDDFTCQQCNQRGGKLVSHHINSFKRFPELRFNVDNGATLCRSCHITGDAAFHRLYGIKDFTEEDYLEWRIEYGC